MKAQELISSHDTHRVRHRPKTRRLATQRHPRSKQQGTCQHLSGPCSRIPLDLPKVEAAGEFLLQNFKPSLRQPMDALRRPAVERYDLQHRHKTGEGPYPPTWHMITCNAALKEAPCFSGEQHKTFLPNPSTQGNPIPYACPRMHSRHCRSSTHRSPLSTASPQAFTSLYIHPKLCSPRSSFRHSIRAGCPINSLPASTSSYVHPKSCSPRQPSWSRVRAQFRRSSGSHLHPPFAGHLVALLE